MKEEIVETINVTKKALKGFIRYKLRTDNQWAVRGLMFMYNKQTNEEQTYSYSTKRNNSGFDKNDAKKLSIIAESYKRSKKLGEDNLELIKKSLPKYWKQILKGSDVALLERQYRKHIIGNEQLIETTIEQSTKDGDMSRTPIIIKELVDTEKIELKSYTKDEDFNALNVVAKDGREYMLFNTYKDATKKAVDIIINHEDDPNIIIEKEGLMAMCNITDVKWGEGQLNNRGGVEGVLSFDGYNRVALKRGCGFRTI